MNRNSGVEDTPPREPNIANEPIDVNTLAEDQAGGGGNSQQGVRETNSADLEEKKKRVRLLEEEIEAEERIARLKRQRRELEEDIAAAEGDRSGK